MSWEKGVMWLDFHKVELRVLPVRYLFRQFSTIFITGKITTKRLLLNVNKRDHRAYDIHVGYTQKRILEISS